MNAEWTPEQAQQAADLVEQADELFGQLMDTMNQLAGLMNDPNADAYFFNHFRAMYEKDNRYDMDWNDLKERVTRRADADVAGIVDDEDCEIDHANDPEA